MLEYSSHQPHTTYMLNREDNLEVYWHGERRVQVQQRSTTRHHHDDVGEPKGHVREERVSVAAHPTPQLGEEVRVTECEQVCTSRRG